MIQIALVENSCESKEKYLKGCELPIFYMEDFSILGFPVSKVEGAKRLLQEEGYRLHAQEGGYNILLENHNQITQISELFVNKKIETSLTDIADTFYQA